MHFVTYFVSLSSGAEIETVYNVFKNQSQNIQLLIATFIDKIQRVKSEENSFSFGKKLCKKNIFFWLFRPIKALIRGTKPSTLPMKKVIQIISR